MRTTSTVLIAIAFVLVAAPSLVADTDTYEARTDHYRVISGVHQDHARETADMMEALMALYNQQFRFPLDSIESPLGVRIFESRARYDDYMRRLLDETRGGYVYLHYGDPAKSELVGYHDTSGEVQASMIHQSFVQYFRTFIPNPPLWIREGFAVHFEATRYDPDFGAAVFRENRAWLNTLQDLVLGERTSEAIPLHRMLELSVEEARQVSSVFYPQAWGMVSFLLHAADADINRILWDSISALSPSASLEENTRRVYDRAFRWVDRAALTDAFMDYVGSQKTFAGWIEHGAAAYDDRDLDEAERSFIEAATLRENHYIPYYFLGLINYERENFSMADYYYQQALRYGIEEPIVLYALGVSAYADNRFDEATVYLESALELDTEYRERAETLLLRIRG